MYLDDQRVGGMEELRNIAPLSVLSVRYYDPIAVSARWGLNHNGGAIYVQTQKKEQPRTGSVAARLRT